MQAGVGPTSDCEDGRVLPGLKAVAMVQVVGGFPVIEDLIAVLDGREGGSE